MKRLFLLFFIFLPFIVLAQYYGRNKIKYEKFAFKQLETEHFIFYYYDLDSFTILKFAQLAEKWYSRHRVVFKDTIPFKNPVIIYNNHADFQQNTVTSEIVDVATGGFTEGNQNRVVMPLGVSWGRTDHVLGHELVHAFQYSAIREDTTLSIRSIMNIPLWMVEGMAEYLSIGSIDAHTAMWIRDAVATDKFPRFKDLWDPRYFPYRWGQAFWAFIDGVYGQDIFITLYKETARNGYAQAFKRVLGLKEDSLAKAWKRITYKQYQPYMEIKQINPAGRLIIGPKKGGKFNVSPTVSPDGRFVAFLSQKDVFTLDMYLADAKSGKIIRKLRVRTNDGHIDAADVYESTGSFSPDGNKIAFVVYEKGDNALLIVNVNTGKVEKEIFLDGVEAFTNPAWSPDGKKIALSVIRQGQTDLAIYDLESEKLQFLTNDIFAQLQPSWSPSGRYLVFVTDSLPGSAFPTKKFRFAIYDLTSGKISIIQVFPNANNLNPIFSSDEKKIYFLSDAEGFRDLFVYEIETGKVKRLTNFFTGISGITMLSPAIAINYATNEVVYSFYYDNSYSIYAASLDSLELMAAEPAFQSIPMPALLPPKDNLTHFINRNIAKDIFIFADLPQIQAKFEPFKNKIKLEYISNVGFGVSNSYRGMGVYGGINLLFGDVLGENRFFFGFSSAQGLETIGGQLAYLNQKNRLWWGLSLTHQPYQMGMIYYVPDKIYFNGDSIYVINAKVDVLTIFTDNLTFFASYPITQTRRIEASISGTIYSFLHLVYNNYFAGNLLIAYNKERLPAPPGFHVENVSLAYIEDNSYFGMTSPMKGKIFSVMPSLYFGSLNFSTLDIDFRRYIFLKPITLAFRLQQSYRFGKDAESGVLPDFYLAYPWYVRGYTYKAIMDYIARTGNYEYIYSFTGSRLIVAGFEVRLPFIGIDQLALIPSKMFFVDLNYFFDSGLTWHSYERVAFSNPTLDPAIHTPIFSTGISARINLFGQLIVEPYIAYPLSIPNFNSFVLGINLMSGW